MKQASGTVKRVSMELGGNACFVVFADADLDEAVDAAMSSKFRNAGQTCVCSDRFLIQSSIHDEFVDKLAAKVRSLQTGHGIEPGTTVGPLITEQAAQTVSDKVEAAIREGAVLRERGTVPPPNDA